MPESSSPFSVRVMNGELRADTPFRSWVMRGWPELTAWERTRQPWRTIYKPRWRSARPEIALQRALILPFHACVHDHASRWCRLASSREAFHPAETDGMEPTWRGRREADRRIIADYFANVPEEVRRAVEPFRFRQWHLLVLAQRCPGGLELIQRNPALAFCLASLGSFNDHPAISATCTKRRLIGRPDREICRAMGFAEPEIAALMLSRTPPAACFDSGLAGLRRTMRSGWREDLALLPAFNEDLLAIITLPAMLNACSYTLLRELAAKPPDSTPSYAGLMWGILRMVDQRFGREAGDALRFHSTRQVARLHARLVRQRMDGLV